MNDENTNLLKKLIECRKPNHSLFHGFEGGIVHTGRPLTDNDFVDGHIRYTIPIVGEVEHEIYRIEQRIKEDTEKIKLCRELIGELNDR